MATINRAIGKAKKRKVWTPAMLEEKKKNQKAKRRQVQRRGTKSKSEGPRNELGGGLLPKVKP